MAVCLLAALAVAVTTDLAGRKPRTLSVSHLPPWAREAVARETPPTGKNAVWLHDERIVEPLEDGGVRITVRGAVRILKASGLDDFHRAAFVYGRDDKVEFFDVWTITPDGKGRRADLEEDFEDAPYLQGYAVYRDTRLKSARFSGLIVNGTAVWTYATVVGIDRGATDCVIGSSSHPAVHSSCTLKVPPGWKWARVASNDGELDLEEREDGFTLSGQDLEPLPTVELPPPARDLMPAVWMRWWSPDGSRGFESWDDVAAWMTDLAAPVFSDLGEAAEVSARLAPESTEGLESSIARAFDFASREVRYVAIEVGIGGYQPYSPSFVCKNRFGDCKDKTYLLRSIVEAWDVKSYPVLVRTENLGETTEEVPTPGQFNHCIAAVALPAGVGDDLWPVAEVEGLGRLLFLDGTSRLDGPWTLPTGDQGTTALVVDGEKGRLVRLPNQPPGAASVRRRLEGRLDAGGGLTGAVLTETWSGTRASSIRRYYEGKTEQQRSAHVLEDLQARFTGAAITEYEISGLDQAGAEVTELTRFDGARLGKRMGDLLIVEPLALGSGVTETALPPPPREWPLDPGNPRRETIEFTLEVPAGWVPEDLPAGEEVSCEDLQARSDWSFADGKIRFTRSADLLSDSVPPERYESFRDAARALRRMDNRGIALVPAGSGAN